MEANNHETRTLRQELVRQRESFVFETVFSDRAGEKLAVVMDAVASGYNVVLCFIGISGPEISEERVAMRMSQGGHYVPPEKLIIRFPRTVANLKAAIQPLPMVLIFDNDVLAMAFRRVAEFRNGKPSFVAEPVPEWLRALLD